ncbi:MAG: DUF4340 domain-containing protein [Acidiferrobacterales bacterium]
MLGRKTILVLAAVTGVVTLAAIFSKQDSSAIPGQGEPLFPELMAQINDARQVSGISGDGSFTIKRRDDGWVVEEKSNYPADADKVHRLLLGTAQLTRIEPKTRKPELYAQLGVEDVDADGSQSLKFTLKNAGGDALADFILGTRRPATGNPNLSEYFVRVPGNPQTWLVEGKLPDDKNPINWVDREILELDSKRVRAVRVTHANGDKIIVRRPDPSADDFELVGLPKGAQIKDVYAVNGIGNGLTNLSLDDVKSASAIRQDKKKAAMSVEITTFDGLRVTMHTRKNGKENLAWFSAAFDPALVYEDTKPEKTETGSEAQDADEQTGLKATDAVKQEAETLNTRWQGWLYIVPQYRVDSVAKKKSDLIKFSKKPDSGKTAGS